MLRPQSFCLVVLLIFTGLVRAAVVPMYNATELRPLPGYTGEWVGGIDNAGQVIGTSFRGDPSQPSASIGTLWTNAAPSSINPIPSNTNSSASAISPNGNILGFSQDYYELYNGVFSSFAESSVVRYNTGGQANPQFINSRGEVIGVFPFYDDNGQPQQGVILWSPGGAAFKTLATIPTDAYISAMNDADQFIGTETIYSFQNSLQITSNLFRYNPDGTFQEIAFANSATANGINNLGQVVGGTFDHAFVWTGNQVNLLLSPSATIGNAESINDVGIIVGGSSGDFVHNGYADLWTPDGSAYDLNTLLASPLSVHLDNATAINSSGDILAYAQISSFPSVYRYFLLTPVPEPATGVAMLMMGVPLLRPRRLAAEPGAPIIAA